MNESCALPFLSSYNDMAKRQFAFGIGFENRFRQPVQLHLQTDLRALRSTFSEYVDGILRAQLRCPDRFANPLTHDEIGRASSRERGRHYHETSVVTVSLNKQQEDTE